MAGARFYPPKAGTVNMKAAKERGPGNHAEDCPVTVAPSFAAPRCNCGTAVLEQELGLEPSIVHTVMTSMRR